MRFPIPNRTENTNHQTAFTEVGSILVRGSTGQAFMFFLLLATCPASPPDTSSRIRDIQAKDQPCFSISIIYVSQLNLKRLDDGEGNMLTAILETHAPRN
jgi:hypothetical protein